MTHKRKLKHMHPIISKLLEKAYSSVYEPLNPRFAAFNYTCTLTSEINILFELASLSGSIVRFVKYEPGCITFHIKIYDLQKAVDYFYEQRQWILQICPRQDDTSLL